MKGYSSKTHISTLCSLIYLYYKSDNEKESLTKEDIELVSEASIEKEEVSYFVEAKGKRETASYGISEEFTKSEAQELLSKTILFVNKVKKILEDVKKDNIVLKRNITKIQKSNKNKEHETA